MNRSFPFLLSILLLVPAFGVASGGTYSETVRSYPVTGQTGLELYQSIGENGPVLENGSRAIAHTTFKLTWRRDYRPESGACVLKSAVPRLVITYTLPAVRQLLEGKVAEKWKVFLAGIKAHEKVHGQHIREMVAEIEQVSVGLGVANDPGCTKIRKLLQEKLAAISKRQRQRGRDFDVEEMADGGNIHRLVLDLVEP